MQKNILTLSVGLCLGVGLSLGQGAWADREAEQSVQNTTLPYESLQTFTEIFGLIKSDYVETVDDQTLLEYAIQGMLSGLDPHSSYLKPEGFEDLKVGSQGRFGGLGIEVTMDNGFVRVIAPIDDTPAQRAGIQAGDMIIRLDDDAVKGLTLRDAVDHMRGEPGSDILLTVIREGEDKPLEITITRAIIKVSSVRGRLLGNGIGYVRISSFQDQSGDQLRDKLAVLQDENEGSLRGLVLDLRNNPGGVLDASVDVADVFLNEGDVVYTKGRSLSSAHYFHSHDGDLLHGAPMVVLVNGGSASASEIVSGALQDRKRAIIMGSRTFGKGSVQTVLPMRGGAAVKLTTARYFTPLGRSIQAEGVSPDITIAPVKVVQKEAAKEIHEKDLSGHLDNPNEKPANADAEQPVVDSKTEEKNAQERNKKKAEKLAKEDYGLYQAFNLLKAMALQQTFDHQEP